MSENQVDSLNYLLADQQTIFSENLYANNKDEIEQLNKL